MANPIKGEVDLVVGEKTYVLRLSANALCEAETVLGQGIAEIASSLGDRAMVRMATVRALLWAALVERQRKMTVFDAGDIISEVGIGLALEKVGEALKLAFDIGAAADPS